MAQQNDLISEIFCECEGGKVDKLLSYLNYPDADINIKSSYNMSLIMVACVKNNIELLKILLNEPKCNVQEVDKEIGLLHIASQYDNECIIKLLLDDGRCDPNLSIKIKETQTPLISAIINNQINICKLLLDDPRIDVNKTEGKNNNTPLHIACIHGDLEIIKLLLEHENIEITPINIKNETPLDIAINEGYYNIVKYLDPDNTSLDMYIACKIGDITTVRNFLDDHDFDPNEIICQDSYLNVAYISGHNDIVKSLLDDDRIDLNITDTNCIMDYAVERNDINLVKLLLEHPKYKPPKDNYPLYGACSSGYIAIIKLFLEDDRFDVNASYAYDMNPLYVACDNHHEDAVRLLLEDSRTDPNMTSGYYKISPLHAICQRYNKNIFNMLIEHPKIDINVLDASGDSPLHYACQFDHLDVIKILLEKGAKHEKNINGTTPLHLACVKNNIEIIKYIEEYHNYIFDNIDDIISNKDDFFEESVLQILNMYS